MKKTLVLGLIILAMVIAACVTPAETEPVATQEVSTGANWSQFQDGMPFRFVHTNRQHPVVRIMMAGFFAACADYGLDCVDMGVDQDDVAGSIAKTEESVALGSSGMVTGVNDQAYYAATTTAIQAGIPVVNMHFPMDETLLPGMTAWVAPDNVGYAAEAARAMGEKLQCQGMVAITQGGLNDGENAVAASFMKTLWEMCPEIQILKPQIEGYDSPAAILVASSMLLGYPEITGAFSTTGNGPTTWAKAAQEVGKKPGEIAIISMDYSRVNLDLLKNGEVYALVGQPLFEEVYHSVVLLVETISGLPVPYENVLPAPLIFQEDAEHYYRIVDMAEAIEIK